MLTCRLYIRNNSIRRRFKDWYNTTPDNAIEYAECLPEGYEADLYLWNPDSQRLTYNRTIHPKGV